MMQPVTECENMTFLCEYPSENGNGICKNVIKQDDNFCSKCGRKIDKKIFQQNFEICCGRLKDGSWCTELLDTDESKACPTCGMEIIETAVGCKVERQNYLKLLILIAQVGSVVLRRFLTFMLRKTGFTCLKNLLDNRLHLALSLRQRKRKCFCGEKLLNIGERTVLKQEQWDGLYRSDEGKACKYTGHDADGNKMDISLLSVILFHFFFLRTEINDNLREAISRIRFARNKVFHLAIPEISKSDYIKRWGIVKKAICTLAYSVSKSDHEDVCKMISDIEYNGINFRRYLENPQESDLMRNALQQEKVNTKERIQRVLRLEIVIKSADNIMDQALLADDLDLLERKIVKGLRKVHQSDAKREEAMTDDSDISEEINHIAENIIKLIYEYKGKVIEVEMHCILLYIEFESSENFNYFLTNIAALEERMKFLLITKNLLFYEQLNSVQIEISVNQKDIQRCRTVFLQEAKVSYGNSCLPGDQEGDSLSEDQEGKQTTFGPFAALKEAKVSYGHSCLPADQAGDQEDSLSEDQKGKQTAFGPFAVLKEVNPVFVAAQEAKVSYESSCLPEDQEGDSFSEDQEGKQTAFGPFAVLKEAHRTTLRKKKDIRIGVFGRSGVGKSALCSCLIQKSLFKSQCSGESVTKKSEFAIMKTNDGRAVYIYDTPGELGRDITKAKVIDFILECVITSQPGFHCIIVAIAIGREPDDISVIKDMETLFDREEFYKNTIIVFTKSDLLDEGQTFRSYRETLSNDLKIFIEKCGNRVLLFTNKLKDERYKRQGSDIIDAAISLMASNESRTVELRHFEHTYDVVERELSQLKQNVDEISARRTLFENPTEALKEAVEADIKSQERFFKYLGETSGNKEMVIN